MRIDRKIHEALASTGMKTTAHCLLLLAFTACGTETPTAPVRQPDPTPLAAPRAAPTAPPQARATPIDRSKDPKFALKTDGNAYVGLVLDSCPAGAVAFKPEQGYKLVGSRREMQLPGGGCPTWAGYSVVLGPGAPIPFYVCFEPRHDMCDMFGSNLWVFELGAALNANHATAVEYQVPTGVH